MYELTFSGTRKPHPLQRSILLDQESVKVMEEWGDVVSGTKFSWDLHTLTFLRAFEVAQDISKAIYTYRR